MVILFPYKPLSTEKSMKIQGKAMWASVLAPNMKFPNPTTGGVYQIDLIIEDKQVAGAKKAGLKVKKTEDGNVVRFRRNEKRRDGTLNKPPVVRDATNQPLTELVGNGSLVNVQFSIYEYDNSFGKGTGADLQGVQVLDLVVFGNADGDEFEVEDEFVSEDNTSVEEATADLDTDDFDDDVPDIL